MTPYPILDDLGLVVVGAAVLVVVGRIARVPPILAYMVAGLLLGPATGLLRVSESLDLFAELGVALLLFVVGLELSVAKIRDFGGTAVVAGAAQVVACAALGTGVALALGFAPPAAAVTGLVVAFSSTAVVVKLLDRTGRMDTEDGRLALGILLVQDVLVVLVLTLLAGWDPAIGASGLGAHLAGLGVSVLRMAAVVAVGAALGRWALSAVVRWLLPSPEALLVLGLTWAFAFMLAAETLHLSVELGAFIAGVILAQVPHSEELRRRTHPLVDFFLAVFFVTLGAGIRTDAMAATWPAALVTAGAVIVLKPTIVAVVLRMAGRGLRTSILAGLTLGQVSEFAFILAALATTVGLVDDAYIGFVGLVGLVSIGASAILVPAAGRIAGAIERLPLPAVVRGPSTSDEVAAPVRSGHVVVVGMNTLGRLLVDRLRDRGVDVLAVDTRATRLEGLPVEGMVGDMTLREVFEASGAPDAALVVTTLQIEDVNSLLTFRCERAGVPISVHAFDPSLAEELLEIGADHLMISKHDGIGAVERALHQMGVLG